MAASRILASACLAIVSAVHLPAVGAAPIERQDGEAEASGITVGRRVVHRQSTVDLDKRRARTGIDLWSQGGDGMVGAEDLIDLLSQWGDSAGAHDVDGDGIVGPADLARTLDKIGVSEASAPQGPAGPTTPDPGKPHALGNCCLPSGECAHLIDVVACTTAGGTPAWPDCGDCEDVGGCCLPQGGCVMVKEDECTDARGSYHGTFMGEGTTCRDCDSCDPLPCQPPTTNSTTPAVAGSKDCDQTDSYDVHGDTCAEANRNLNSPEAGFTTYEVSCVPEIRTVTKRCENGKWICKAVLTKVTIDMVVTITMPDWIEHDSAPAADQTAWDQFYAALLQHEEGHRDIYCDSYDLLAAALTAVPPQLGCGDTRADACEDAAEQLEEDVDTVFQLTQLWVEMQQALYHIQVGTSVPINCP